MTTQSWRKYWKKINPKWTSFQISFISELIAQSSKKGLEDMIRKVDSLFIGGELFLSEWKEHIIDMCKEYGLIKIKSKKRNEYTHRAANLG